MFRLASPRLAPGSRLTFRPAPSEDDGLDGDSFWGLPQRVEDGTLVSWTAKARVGVSAGFP